MYYPRPSFRGQIRNDEELLRLFFDFYALNEIWFRTVGKIQYGFSSDRVLPCIKESRITETFEKVVVELKRELINALEYSVRAEARHWHDETYERHWHDETYEWCRRSVVKKGRQALINNHVRIAHKAPLSVIEYLFSLRCWNVGYGGKRWAKATNLLIQLKQSNNLKNDVFLIDQILDLQHNTGHLLNKTSFSILSHRRLYRRQYKKVKRFIGWALNYRFKATLSELLEHSSPIVRYLFIANRNYLT